MTCALLEFAQRAKAAWTAEHSKGRDYRGSAQVVSQPPSHEEIRREADSRLREIESKQNPMPERENQDDGDQVVANKGWIGVGKPMVVGAGAKERCLVDGGGLCSPGFVASQCEKAPGGCMSLVGPTNLGKFGDHGQQPEFNRQQAHARQIGQRHVH